MNPVNWFEIPVSDMDRAKTFYEAVLETELSVNDFGGSTMAWFPMDPEGAGATGTLILAETYTPSYDGTMVYFPVKDIEATLGRVVKAGGKVVNPKQSIGEFGFVGHFEDSEGNRVGLHSQS